MLSSGPICLLRFVQGGKPNLQVAMLRCDGLANRIWLEKLVKTNAKHVQLALSLLYEKTEEAAAQKHQKMASLCCCSCGGTKYFAVSCEDECGTAFCYDCVHTELGYPVEPTSNGKQDGKRWMYKIKHDHHRCKIPNPKHAFVPLPTLIIGLVATKVKTAPRSHCSEISQCVPCRKAHAHAHKMSF